MPSSRPRSDWCSEAHRHRQKARERVTRKPQDGFGRHLAVVRGEDAPRPAEAPVAGFPRSVRTAADAEVAALDDDELLEGSVAHLADALVHLAGRLDEGPQLSALPSLVLEVVRTHRALVAAVEAAGGEYPLPAVASPASVDGGLLVMSTWRRLSELSIDPVADVLAAVALLVAAVLDAGSCGTAEAPLTKVWRSLVAALRPRVLEIDEDLAELLRPLVVKKDTTW